ncbi:MAG TPA: hypothetical protein VEU50_25580, partial [Archangium sp.]|nr:hypothetical protein [Archangium sp.]
KPGGVGTPGAMLRKYFEPWLSALSEEEQQRLRAEALRRMGPEADAFESACTGPSRAPIRKSIEHRFRGGRAPARGQVGSSLGPCNCLFR